MTLALVFTDIVDSTALGVAIGDESMGKIRRDHFAQGDRLVQEFDGWKIKTIGDSVMAAFHSIAQALDFARAFLDNPGHPKIKIRAGIHVREMDIEGNDAFGAEVNFAARVVGENKGAEIWLSDEAKSIIERHGAERFKYLSWKPHQVTPKGFPATTFWSVSEPTSPTEPSASPVREGGVSSSLRTFTAKLPTVDTLLIGRDPELAFLEKAWTESAKIVQIIAPGGTGKTALMDKWFRRHLNEVTIFGWSFYSQGSKQDRQTSSDPFFAEILAFFDITIKEGASVWARAEAIAARLREERVLLILDGMEPLQESTGELRDSPLKALLQELRTHNAGMVVCTTRVRIKELPEDEQCRSCNLDNLHPKDGALLLDHLDVKGTPEELEKASSDYGNHALALTLLGTYLRDFHHGDIRHRTEIRGLLTEESDADGHANRVMASYAKMFEGKPELQLLRALGYFDRPAEPEAIRLVLQKMDDQKYHAALVHLNKARLILSTDLSDELDCHPLVREYFAGVMRTTAPEEFKKGHGLLFEHYSKRAPHLPDTRREMIPLFYAVYHGCQAGRHQEALEATYVERIYRRNEFYLYKKLGEFGTNLSLLANFFKEPWTKPWRSLPPGDQAWLVGEAALTLRAIGRLTDAVAPVQHSGQAHVDLSDWNSAARQLLNLGELHVALGYLDRALPAARQSIQYADQSQDNFLRSTTRVVLAEVLHQSGNLPAAARLLEEAEGLKEKHTFPILCSLSGYRYCAVLLDQGERAEVLRRAKLTLKFAEKRFGPLAIGLDNLSLGKAYMRDSTESSMHLEEAVTFIRLSGALEFLPPALLARATPHDVEEAFTIATRCGMRLHLADYHLIQARRLKSIEHFYKAEALINETGYHRRDQSLADLRKDLFPNQQHPI